MLITAIEVEEKLIIRSNTKKVFIFDLDGTIIYDDKPLSSEFERQLLKINNAGHQLIIATGRSIRDVVAILPNWCLQLPLVAFGGGVVTHQDQLISHEAFPSELAEQIIKILEDNNVNYLADSYDNYYHPEHSHWLFDSIIQSTGQKKAVNINKLLNGGIYKILVLDDHHLKLFEEFGTSNSLAIHHHSYHDCFDIMPQNVNKYNGLLKLNLKFHPDDIFIFGNDNNDLELMQNIHNSTMFGQHKLLDKYAKVKIDYNQYLVDNFTIVVSTIVNK